MTRRTALALSAAAAAMPGLSAAPAPGRLKQSFARWCYAKIPLEDLCRQAAEIGCVGIDLIDAPDWPMAKKYGLTPAMVQGEGKIPTGWNHKENHEMLDKQLRVLIGQAAEAKLPNVITFSGNRRGMNDDEGKANCIEGLRKVVKQAEDSGVTICMELLNSKVNHKDYMADHTAWGVDVCKGVDSPRFKLLYDIYHMQIMEGDIIHTVKDNIQYIGHFHTGGVPGRHELDDTQELQWRTIAKAIADLNFTGYFAHEFQPLKDPITSLKQAVELCTV